MLYINSIFRAKVGIYFVQAPELLFNPILPTFILPLHLKDAFVHELFEVVAGS